MIGRRVRAAPGGSDRSGSASGSARSRERASAIVSPVALIGCLLAGMPTGPLVFNLGVGRETCA